MALRGDGGLLSLEPSSVDMQGVVYAIKLTQDVAEKLIANDQALTLSLEKVGGGKLTVGEETMSLSVRDENHNKFECYSRQSNRCIKVGGVHGVVSINRELSADDARRQRERTLDAEREKKSRKVIISEGAIAKPNKRPKASKLASHRNVLGRTIPSKQNSRRPKPLIIPSKRPTPSPYASPSSPNGSSAKPSAKPSLHSRPKPPMSSLSSRHTSPQNSSRAPSPATAPSSPKGAPRKKIVGDMRLGVLHILALGNTTLTTVRDRLPEFDYGKKTEIMRQVATYTGGGYKLKDDMWDEVDPDWPFYSEPERKKVKAAKEQIRRDRRINEMIKRMPPPPSETQETAALIDRAWARWHGREFVPRREIESDEMDSEYREFFVKWYPSYTAVVRQLTLLQELFEGYGEVYESLEEEFELEAADKHIHSIASKWMERKNQGLFLIREMHKELKDCKLKINKYADEASSHGSSGSDSD